MKPGERLGPYEVLGLIGAGGMGEVYKARDTRLDRTVAIKVLPAELSLDPERRARFDREARAISSLAHPHICTLYDIGEHVPSTPDSGVPNAESRIPSPVSVHYLVMEHLAGETLAERLRRGPVPLAQALDIAAQIAEALDAAHKHGIVHRDLKPGNVMLTTGGAGRSGVTSAKLLDFGLAKLAAHGERPALVGDASALTQTAPITSRGTILGTLQYMAPEQLEGKEADARTDLWALGAILYEMVTSKRAFEGDSEVSLIGNIMNAEPAVLATMQPLTPPALERVVRKCLAKHPDDRWDTAHDVADELRWIAQGSGSQLAVPVARPRRRVWLSGAQWGLSLVGIVLLAALAAGLIGPAPGSRVANRRVVRFTIDVPVSRQVQELALSPDASHVAYVGSEGELSRVFVRAIDQLADRAVPGTEGASSPFFSPDGRWVGFFADDKLKKVPVAGGEAFTICEARGTPRSPARELIPTAAWSDDGTIVFAGATTGLSRVSAFGGTPVPVTTIDVAKGELGHAWPALLPGGKMVLFSTVRGMDYDGSALASASLGAGTHQVILKGGGAARFLRPGYLLYVTEAALNVVGFDPARGRVLGQPVGVIDDMGFSGWAPQYDVSPAGDLVYLPAVAEPRMHVMRVDRRGRAQRVTTLEAGFGPAMDLAADGRRVLLYRHEGRRITLWLFDIPRGVVTKVASDGIPHAGVWSPDGSKFVFSSNRTGAANLFVQAADGSGTAEQLVTSPQHQDPGSWSHDGRWVAFAEIDPVNGWDLWKLDMTTRQASPIRRTAGQEQRPAISPDGRWIAYQSSESGRFEVYAEAFPAGGKRVQLSADGGTEPAWSPDGRELFYRAGPRLLSVSITGGSSLSAGPPAQLLEGPFAAATTYGPPGYAVAPDGQHFYFLQRVEQAPVPRRIKVALGWVGELEQRLAGSR